MTKRAFAPHCDQRILHAPTSCEHCDKYPDWQEMRAVQMINYTGQYEEAKSMCPSEVMRSLDTIYRWAGNRPEHEKRRRLW